MTQAAIAADLAQTLDVQCGLATQVALDDVCVDGVTQLLLISVSQILDADVRIDASLFQNILGGLSANAVDIGEADFDTLILRQVNTGNTCHTL